MGNISPYTLYLLSIIVTFMNFKTRAMALTNPPPPPTPPPPPLTHTRKSVWEEAIYREYMAK